MKRMASLLGTLAIALVLASCRQKSATAPMMDPAPNTPGRTPPGSYSVAQATGASSVTVDANTANRGSEKGAGGQMPAYYDGELFTINSVEVSETASDRIGSNPSHNDIYVTNDLDDPQDFVPVIDAIQGDGFNPLWEQIRIVFKPGVTPHQFFSDDEVEEAASGANPEITLEDTHEVYRCSVVGKK